jgi:energy-converting hydrogenase Eha subunit F
MRTVVVLLIAAVLGGLFIAQKLHEQKATPAPASAQQTSTPRPVSEHNWAKHALDTTTKVTSQVAKQRKDDGVRK